MKAVVWVLTLNDAGAEHFKTLVLVLEVRTQRHEKLKPFKTNQTQRERDSVTLTQPWLPKKKKKKPNSNGFSSGYRFPFSFILVSPPPPKKTHNLLINWELNWIELNFRWTELNYVVAGLSTVIPKGLEFSRPPIKLLMVTHTTVPLTFYCLICNCNVILIA